MSVVLDFIPYDVSELSNVITSKLDNVITHSLYIFEYIDAYYTLIVCLSLLICYLMTEIFYLLNEKVIDPLIPESIETKDNNQANVANVVKDVKKNIPLELYFPSILEVMDKNTDIVSKIANNTDYWILLRVVMKNPLTMKRSKYELHGNNVGDTRNKVFSTRDMYMVIKLRFNDYEFMNGEIKFNMANAIVRCMNHLNHISPEGFKTKDFIVVAISTKPIANTNTGNEFYNGLINNNYELFNFKEMNIKIDGKDGKFYNVGYIMMLPIHEIYDIFMDVYNTTLFETAKYAIDDNNYESWNGISINELKF